MTRRRYFNAYDPSAPFSKRGMKATLPSPPFEKVGLGGISLYSRNTLPYLALSLGPAASVERASCALPMESVQLL
jgi:hypothetical protein